VPEVGESVSEVIVGQWFKEDGQSVRRDEVLCVIESEKAAMEIVAEVAGILRIRARQGETLQVGEVLGEIDTSAVSGETGGEEKKAEEKDKTADKKVRVTPVAKKILAEAGIPAAGVKGTGPAGRVTKADALAHLEAGPNQSDSGDSPPARTKPDRETEPDHKPGGEPCAPERTERREPMTTLRKAIAQHLVAAKNDTAMLTTINEVDMSAVLDLRREFKEAFLEKYGIKLGFMSLFARASCVALKEWPVVNAKIVDGDIVYHDYVDLSVAVSTPRGLVAPVVRDAQSKSLAQLEKDIQQLAERARDGRLTIDEMSGGTFTLTNGGVFGSLISTPIINTPQSAVLGMHTIVERPVADQGKVVIRPMMYVALSYDHRIIDGREAVLFLLHIKTLLESTNRLLLEV
jgi:2-oxoglutarate dehydrogenase E2 component (dihydrolipoamide succinyltransferase)